VSGDDEAWEIAKRLATAVRGPVQVRGSGRLISVEPVPVEASVGVVLANATHMRPVDLLRDADLAMYSAKARGRGRVEMHTSAMRAEATRRQQLETALRAAVEAERLDVAYQPILRLADGAVAGLEALARWVDPVHGSVPPAEFIPLAEETGIIVALGTLVLQRACAQVAEWQRADPRYADLQLAVNVSARQLVHPDFFDTVQAVVATSRGRPQSLTLEITESTLMESAGPAMAAIGELKTLGVSIAIDDFGTGYSSLAYLNRLPIDGLKVDRAFVNGLAGANTQDTAVVRAVLSLADTLGLRVTAEGVENEAQEDHLRRLRCQYAQGYRFSKPLSVSGTTDWLAGVPVASGMGVLGR
jgi:EAL domain-containing protein (putative c-di-GMP-specific phosphodiesterase class I)